MLDLRYVRNNAEQVRRALEARGSDADLRGFQGADEQRRTLLQEVEQKKNRRNTVSEEIAAKKKKGEDATDTISEMRSLSQEIKELDERVKAVEEQVQGILLEIPNIPHPSVPVGQDEADNALVRQWGDIPDFSFPARSHWDVGEGLGILDFARGSKISGARFTVYRGFGARLERSLISFMLDVHTTQHGYTEVFPPFIVNEDSMVGTGQLPKFREDMFKLEGYDYYLIPTAEVPVTNLHRDEILEPGTLPLYYAAYSACFRAEAGAAGRETRGLIRQHQFNKVEMVKFTEPDRSYQELEALTANAEKILQLLELPYRLVTLCTGDLGFSAAKTYDLEVWMPGYDDYKEISSCSNFEDFQARRAGIRYRPAPGARPEFVHTLNGSGVAVGRTVAAILENYQREDGSLEVPRALRSYMGGQDIIRPD